MYLMKDPPYEKGIHFDQTWQLKLNWNDETKNCGAITTKQISFRISTLMEHKYPLRWKSFIHEF